MSLEAALQENTAVMRELIARMTGSSTAVTMTGSDYVAKIDKAAGETKPTTAKAAVEAALADAKAAKASKETEAALDYEKDVRPLLVKLSTSKGRDALIQLLSDNGVTKGDQLKPEQFGAVVGAAKDLMAA